MKRKHDFNYHMILIVSKKKILNVPKLAAQLLGNPPSPVCHKFFKQKINKYFD